MTSQTAACPAGHICPGGPSTVSCDVYSLLQNNPLAAVAADGTTIAQLVYGKGLPAGGLYCPGTAPAGPCPAGSYCPDPLHMLPCPAGHFCPTQSIAPLSCSWLSHCPSASALPSITWGAYIGIFILMLVLVLLWWAGLTWLLQQRRQRLTKCRQKVIASWQLACTEKQTGCELARMPTLASVHSKQATISLEIQPAQLAAASDMFLDRLDRAEPLQLEHTQLHLLLCPWQSPLQQALQALAGNKKAAQAVGHVRYNMDMPSTKVYRHLVRLAPQEDALEGALTVLQNLQLAAHLALPPHFTPHRRATLVEEVLDLMGLSAMQHCLVGTPSSASSGGLTALEHKLVAVATKLVTCPALLLLDQPLGPLCQPSQAAAARHLLTSLRTAAHQLHINVVVTAETLQDAAFDAVDNVVMLDRQARLVYAGPPQKAGGWFKYLGFASEHTAPVSFSSSVIVGDTVCSQDEVNKDSLHALWAAQGQAWQLCPPPKTPPSPTPTSAAKHKRPQKPLVSSAEGLSDPQKMSAAQVSTYGDSQSSPSAVTNNRFAGVAQRDSQVPKMHLPMVRNRSGNPFASVQSSIDDTASAAAGNCETAAATAAAGVGPGAVVPPLALHKLPTPFGLPPGHSGGQPMQSRLGLMPPGNAMAESFTSTSLSYSEMPSTGYTTRCASPDVGLKPHFLRQAALQAEEYNDPTLAVSNPLFGCTPKRGNSPDNEMIRCDSDDYGRVNPLFSSPALVRPSPLRAGPVAEGMEEDLRAALARQDFLPPASTSSERQSQSSDDEQQPAQQRSSIFAHVSSWWQRAKMNKRNRAVSGRQDDFQEAEEGQERPAGGRLRTDMITIEVPSSRCSSASHPSRSRLNTEMDEEGLPLPPLSTSSSPTRRLTKQASDAAAAMLLAISDASPIPRSPKPGPVPNRSWFVDLSPRKSTNLTLMRASPNAIKLLQPVSLAAFRSFMQQLWQQHCLDLVLTVILALLLGMLHGPAWQMQQVPAAALGAALSVGLLSLHATLTIFAGVPAGGMAVLHCPWLHFLLAAVQHTLLAAVRSTIFAAIYFSLVHPALHFGSLLLVLVLVSCWCTGLGLLLARLLPVHHLGTMSLSILFAVGPALNGVFPSLRQLHSTPWFLISGLSFTRWATEVLTIQQFRSLALYMRPVGLYTLSQHGYCGLQSIVYWDVGAYITRNDAAGLLQLVQQGSRMCSSYVDHDLIALAVQSLILSFVAAVCHSLQVYLARKEVSGSMWRSL